MHPLSVMCYFIAPEAKINHLKSALLYSLEVTSTVLGTLFYPIIIIKFLIKFYYLNFIMCDSSFMTQSEVKLGWIESERFDSPKEERNNNFFGEGTPGFSDKKESPSPSPKKASGHNWFTHAAHPDHNCNMDRDDELNATVKIDAELAETF